MCHSWPTCWPRLVGEINQPENVLLYQVGRCPVSSYIFAHNVILVVDSSGQVTGQSGEVVLWPQTRNGRWFSQLCAALGRLEAALAHRFPDAKPANRELRVVLLRRPDLVPSRVAHLNRQLTAVICLPSQTEGDWCFDALAVKTGSREVIDSLRIPVLALAPGEVGRADATFLAASGATPVAPSWQPNSEFWPLTNEHGLLRFLAQRSLGDRFDAGLLRGILTPDRPRLGGGEL